jgi:peptidoglycan-N-acetylglucosamine deacetylase
MKSLRVLLHRTPFWRPLLYDGLWKLPARSTPTQAKILLSFDDGPSTNSLAIAKILEANQARGLFFLCGDRFPKDPSQASEQEKLNAGLAKSLAAAGHMLGCHGLQHRRYAFCSTTRVRGDLREASRRMEQALGQAPRVFRPPYGSWAPWLKGLPERLGMRTLFWSLNPFDYQRSTPDALIHSLKGIARDGDILLLHCTGPAQANTLEALPALLDNLRSEGLVFQDPSALIEEGIF